MPLKQFRHKDVKLENEEQILRTIHRCASASFANPALQHVTSLTPASASSKVWLAKDPIMFMLGGDFMSYCTYKQAFIRIPDVPDDLSEQLDASLLALDGVEKGASWVHLNAADTWSRRHRLLLYGDNENTIPIPSLLGLFFADLLQPVLIVQFIKLPLWMYLFSYYIYPSVLLAVILAGQGVCAYLAYHKALRLASLTLHTRLVPYVNKGYVRAMKAWQLVPGDIIVVVPGQAVCDMVLLRGNCLVEESVLSGEVLQTRKTSFVKNSPTFGPQKYHPDTHGNCTVLAGSKVVQVWNDQDENDETLAMVVRTGHRSAIGSMLHSNAHATRTLADHVMFKDGPKFGGISNAFQVALFIAVIPTLVKYHLGGRFVCCQLLLVFLNAVPPLLPTASAMLGARTILRMRQQNLHVADPQKLLAGAQIDMLLFDKTGTLTIGQGYLVGVVEWESGQLSALRKEPITWSDEIRKLLALCNDLTPSSRDKVTGPEDEVKIFKQIEAAFVSRNSVCLPHRLSNQSTSPRLARVDILLRLEYNAMMLMSGAIARAEHAKKDTAQVFVKGAPFEVAALVGFAALPQGWGAAMAHWTGLGYRVLGLAVGKLLPASAADRQQLSKINLLTLKQHVSDLRMIGLAIISTPLRPGTELTIRQLYDRAGVQPVMVTGDHYLTATAVAKGINLITTKQHALIGKMPVMPACPGQPPASAGPITGAVPAPAGAAASSAGAIASSAGTAAAVPAAATAVKASGAAIFEQPVEVEQSGSSSSAQIPDKHQVRFAATVDQTGKLSHSHAAPASLVQEADAGSALQPSSALPVAASLADVHVSLPAQHLAGPAAEQTAGSTLPGTTSVSRAFAVAKSAAAAAKSGAVKAGMSADTAATESAGTVLPGVAEMPLRDNATALPMAQSAALAKPHKATAAPALPMQQAAQAMQQAADPKQPAADTSAHLPDKAAAEAASLSLSMRNLYPSPSAAMSSQKASPAVIPTAATEGAAPGRLAAAGAVVSALRSAVQNAALTVLTDAQNGTALDVFGNEVSRLPLHERTSRHLAAADAASGMTAHETEKTHSSASRRRSLDAGPGATVNANSMPVSDTHQGTSKPTAEVLPVAATSSADAPQHVLLSAAVQNSALYAQLTCSIATTEDVQMASAAQAFRAAAEGMQCIITGAVFDFLLEHAEPAVLETVLRSTVVYARMKSHQKAQLVSLLGTEGLTTAAGREFKGLGHVVGYAGDGINDVEALRAADVGVAIGTGAVIAASVYTPANSLHVLCTLLLETRCGVMIAYTLNKYLILYGFVRMLTNTVTVIVAHREVSNTEYELLDFCTMAMCIAFILALPSHQLHPDPRPKKLLTVAVIAPIGLYATLYCIQQGIAQLLVNYVCAQQPPLCQDLAASAAALMGVAQLLVPAVSFFKDMWPHTAGFGRNMIVIGIYMICSALVIAWTLLPSLFASSHGAVWRSFPFSFRGHMLVLIVATNFLAIILSNIRRCVQPRHRSHASNAVVPLNR